MNEFSPRSLMLEKSYLYGDDDSACEAFKLVCDDCGTSFHPTLEAVYPDRDKYFGSEFGWKGRGEFISILLDCEGSCKKKRLIMGNHKGDFDVAILKTELENRFFEE